MTDILAATVPHERQRTVKLRTEGAEEDARKRSRALRAPFSTIAWR
jgi:hypothetical protein